MSGGISRGRSIIPVNLLLRPRAGSGGGGGGGSVRPVTVSRDRSRSIAISLAREIIARYSIDDARWRNNNGERKGKKERRRRRRRRRRRKKDTHLTKILQKQPKLEPFGTSLAYDIVISCLTRCTQSPQSRFYLPPSFPSATPCSSAVRFSWYLAPCRWCFRWRSFYTRAHAARGPPSSLRRSLTIEPRLTRVLSGVSPSAYHRVAFNTIGRDQLTGRTDCLLTELH